MRSTNNCKRVVLLNRFFFPDQSPTSVLLSDLAFALGERDFDVTVITSRLRYDDRDAELLANEAVRGIDIRRVWSFRSGRDHLVERSLEYFSFYLSAGFCLWRLARPGDVIVAKTDPPLLSVLAGTIVRLRGARLINWLQDLFPEVAERLGVAGAPARPLFDFLRLLRNRSLDSATANVVLGLEMKKTLEREGIASKQIKVIPNWSDGELIKPVPLERNELRARWNFRPDDVVVGYVGNFGRVHDFDTILEAISLHQQRAKLAPVGDITHNIVFLLVGGGAQRARVEHEIALRKLTNVRLHPYQPSELLPQTLSAADIHLISLRPEMEGLIVPSKFYGIAAVARPAIFIGSSQGEIARLIEHAKCGLTVEPGNAERLLEGIISLARNRSLRSAMGVSARLAFEREWDKCHALARWEMVIETAFNQASRPLARSRNSLGLLRREAKWWSYPNEIKTSKVRGDGIRTRVDKSHKLANDFVPEGLTKIRREVIRTTRRVFAKRDILESLRQLNEAARAHGVDLSIVSAYRSYQYQAELYEHWVQKENGDIEAADRYSARPGHSEHQLGTALDFSSAEINDEVGSHFSGTRAAEWLRANAERFGFYLSFPEGREKKTGFMHESWHYRYWGKALPRGSRKHRQMLKRVLGGAVRLFPAASQRLSDFIWHQLVSLEKKDEACRRGSGREIRRLEERVVRLQKANRRLERQRAKISDQWSQALLRTLRTLRREPVPPNVICELQSQGLVTVKALKQELDYLFQTRRFSNLLQLIDNNATVSRDMANYYHGLLEIYGGQVGSHCRNLKTCKLDSLPELMREPTRNLLIEIAIREGQIDTLSPALAGPDNNQFGNLPPQLMLGACRLLLSKGEARLAERYLEAYLDSKSDEEVFYFLEPLRALSSPRAAGLNSWRAVLNRLAEWYAARYPARASYFNSTVVAQLSLIPRGDRDLLDIRFSRNQRRRLLNLVGAKLANKEPLSLIRIGDGSAYAFPPNRDLPFDLNAGMERVWWGEGTKIETREDIVARVRTAVSSADVLGIPSVYRLIRDRALFGGPFGDAPAHIALAAVLGALGSTIPVAEKIFTEERCNYVAFDKSALETIAKEATKVVFVSCWSTQQMGFRTRCATESITISPDQKTASSIRQSENKPLWLTYPDVIGRVREMSAPGHLVLVGAGILGKVFVHEARQAGAVALDIGSMPDYFAGYKTRDVWDLI